MIRHQMAGIAQASDGWNQFLSHQGGLGHATFRPNKQQTMIFAKTQRSQKPRNQTCNGSTKCNQLLKHSNTHTNAWGVSDQLTLLSVRVLSIVFPLCQFLRKLQPTPGTYRDPDSQPPVYEGNPFIFVFRGTVPGVCSRVCWNFLRQSDAARVSSKLQQLASTYQTMSTSNG